MDEGAVAARELAARRRRVHKQCEVCGTPIAGVVQRRYCSNRCALKASRSRRGHGARPAPAPERPAITAGGIPPLVARLDATAAAIARGRTFDDSADAIREAREARTGVS